MKSYHLFIRLLSYTSIGSGKGSVYVDQEFLTDAYGLPFINGNRIKGLLREALLEYLEMTASENPQDLVNALFGKSQTPDSRSAAQISHARPADYDQLVQDILALKLSPEVVSRLSGNILYRTKINDDGVAADKTLRNIRVLNPGWVFRADVSLYDEQQAENLKNAVNSLRALGSRRNRGKGEVLAWLEEQPSQDTEQPQSTGLQELSDTATYELHYTLEMLDPVVASGSGTDINTLHSLDYIPGNMLWGAIASADTTNISASLFNNPAVRFLGAFPTLNGKRAFKSPLSWQWNKDVSQKDREVYDMLFATPKEANYKTIDGTWVEPSEDNSYQKVEVKLRRSFHTSRQKHRASGRSEDGEIFYKVQLAEGQKFTGIIQSPGAAMKQILERLRNKSILHFGKSKYGENGRVALHLGDLKAVTSDQDAHASADGQTIGIYFRSPALFLNENGFPEVSVNAIAAYVQEKLGLNKAPTIIENYLRPTQLEHFSGVKRSKTGLWPAVAMGSALKLKTQESVFPAKLKALEKEGLGEWTHRGYGEVSALFLPEKPAETTPIKFNKKTEEKKPDHSESHQPLTAFGKKAKLDMAMTAAKQKAVSALASEKHYFKDFSRTGLGNYILLFRNVKDAEQLNTALEHLGKIQSGKNLQPEFRKKMQTNAAGEAFELHRIYWLTLLRLKQKQKKKDEGRNKQ
ncbi:MAG: RAMP superfamily CRISPR-associated protein [Bacteroidota bacterium]|jgi:CRISPR/Cas system CSM-associated protein Csm3 (group 7 of RAMP superfamily)